MEGFICPICYKDLKTALTLSNHFQNHSQDDQKLLKSVKGEFLMNALGQQVYIFFFFFV